MRATVNGTQIYFDVDGPQLEVVGGAIVERPTVVALHGGPGFDQGYLRPGLGPLRAHARVVYVDLRGQGRSGRPPVDTCSLEQMADDVAALCDLLEIDRPIVFGHSAGGFVALHLAIRHPRNVGGLVLCDTAPTMAPTTDDQPAPSLASRASAEVLAVAGRFWGGDMSPEALAAFNEHVAPFYGGPSHMDVPGRLFPLSGMVLAVAQHFFGKLARDYDVRGALGGIAVPTLVVVGRHDWVCPPAANRAIARAIPGAELIELAESGHLGFSEEPERFLEAVSAFIRRVSDARATASP